MEDNSTISISSSICPTKTLITRMAGQASVNTDIRCKKSLVNLVEFNCSSRTATLERQQWLCQTRSEEKETSWGSLTKTVRVVAISIICTSNSFYSRFRSSLPITLLGLLATLILDLARLTETTMEVEITSPWLNLRRSFTPLILERRVSKPSAAL